MYKMGCKGPMSSHNCPTVRYNDGTNWPIGAGHPCIGCSEPGFWDMPTYVPIELVNFTPPRHIQPITPPQNEISPVGAAIAGGTLGVIAGAAGAFAYNMMTDQAVKAQKLDDEKNGPEEPPDSHAE